jgi:hypothetical protein
MILSWLKLRTCAAVLAAMTFSMALPSTADAQVVLTFVAKRGSGGLDFPHSMLRITGTTQSGEAIDRNFGFMPVDGSLTIALGRRVTAAVIDRSEASIPWDLITPHLSVQIPDTALDAVIVRFRYWNENENGGYDVYSQNCIAFLADIAGTVGLKVPPGDHLSPAGFLTSLAELNPPGSHPGILPEPVANPVIKEQPDLPPTAVPESPAAGAPQPAPAPVPAGPEPALT